MNFVALDEVAKIDRTVASDKDCQILPYVGLEHIEKDTGHFLNDFKRDSETLLASKFKFSSSHVLYGKLRPYLNKVALPSFEGVCTTEILPILPNFRLLDRRYLWLIFLSPKFVAWASKSVSGANLPRLDPKELAQYQIPLPPLEEQKRIAKIASKCDRIRRTRRYTQQLSDTYLQSVFLEMFGDPIANSMQWEISNLESQLERIESGWSPVCEEIPRSNPKQWAVLRLGAVKRRNFHPGENKLLPEGLTPRPELEVKKGDLLISRKNTFDLVAECTLVHETPSKLMIPDTMFRFVLRKSSKVNSTYLWGLFNEKYFRKKVQSLANGTAGSMPNISKEKFFDLQIPIPEHFLQEKFAQIVQRFERLRAQQRESDRQAEHLFQTVLHRAFSGEL
jgi:type I restriction enzyme, S subunit